MAEAGANVILPSWFSWEEHFLDFMLVFWISGGLLIVTVVNSLTTLFGPLQPRISWDRAKTEASSATMVAQGPTHPESTFWLNSALNWFYLHYNRFPEFVDAWVAALNEQANKLGGPVQIKFEKVQSGSLPPKFADVTYDAGLEDKYVVTCRVDSRDLSFAVFASQQTHEGVKLTNLKITILRLRGQLRFRCSRKDKDMMAEIGFLGRPDIKLEGKPVNPYMDPSDLVDVGVVEEVVRNTLCLASTNFNVSKWIQGPEVQEQQMHSVERQRSSDSLPFFSSSPISPKTPDVFEMRENQQQFHSAFQVPSFATNKVNSQCAQQASQGNVDKKLLVKVIKASGLKQSEGAIDPCCIINVDQPPQSEVTDIIKNTYNPFWDEQFYFDVTGKSQEIKFEILDKRHPQTYNLLGEATVYVEDLLKNPSSRQSIPLQGRLGAGEFVSGSVTVEFLCMDLYEDIFASMPRKMIETSKSLSPAGMVVTMTTTTQRPQNSRYDTSIDGSPNYIAKQTFGYSGSEPHLGAAAFYRPPSATESLPTDEYQGQGHMTHHVSTFSSPLPEIIYPEEIKEKKSLVDRIRKQFSRSKKRSLSADRASSSLRDGSNYLQPPAGTQSKDDIDLHRTKLVADVPNLKKSRSLGGSLKKLFRRNRKRSKSVGRGEQSCESSLSRHSKQTSQQSSREGSLTRSSDIPIHQDTLIL